MTDKKCFGCRFMSVFGYCLNPMNASIVKGKIHLVAVSSDQDACVYREEESEEEILKQIKEN